MKHTDGMDSDAGVPESGRAVGRKVRFLLAESLSSAFTIFDEGLFLNRIERLAGLLAVWGSRVNLTAAPENPCEILFHVMDSVAPIMCSNDDELCRAFASSSRVLDLGSGAGFPGLVLASASSASFTFLESRQKRASFLAIAAAEMGLANVTIKQQRLTRHAGSRRGLRSAGGLGTRPVTSVEVEAEFDVVTARAFAAPPAFLSAAASVLKPGGLAILYASPGQNLAVLAAEKSGLHDFRHVIYTVSRGNHEVERVLALWRRD